MMTKLFFYYSFKILLYIVGRAAVWLPETLSHNIGWLPVVNSSEGFYSSRSKFLPLLNEGSIKQDFQVLFYIHNSVLYFYFFEQVSPPLEGNEI